jgi:type 1 fimbriae regulatory protein FimB
MKPTGKSFFVSEQRKALHRSTVNLALKTCSKAAALPFLAHPHMLRHACGFALADQGADTRLIQDYLGHRNISISSQRRRLKCILCSVAPGYPRPIVTIFR